VTQHDALLELRIQKSPKSCSRYPRNIPSEPNRKSACREGTEANYPNDRAVKFNKRPIGEAYMGNYIKSAEALSRLSAEEFQVTQRNGTERPFENAYWDHDEPGIYVDIVSAVFGGCRISYVAFLA
jgi:hypothetical protein